MFVCKCVLYYCHRVCTQLQLNISYHIAHFPANITGVLYTLYFTITFKELGNVNILSENVSTDCTIYSSSSFSSLSFISSPPFPTCYVITYPFRFFRSYCPNTQLYRSSEIWQGLATSKRGEYFTRRVLSSLSAFVEVWNIGPSTCLRPSILRLPRRRTGPSSLYEPEITQGTFSAASPTALNRLVRGF